MGIKGYLDWHSCGSCDPNSIQTRSIARHTSSMRRRSNIIETVTARNQTHEFEIFCRKLCERTICPNLKPATGPEGGGDSKAGTETIPIADEIAALTYVGDVNASRERWAFAFSAKKKWAENGQDRAVG
jgi:hypothetical protein